MMRVWPFTMVVSLSNPANGQEFEAVVEMPNGIQPWDQGEDDLKEALKAAAAMFKAHIVQIGKSAPDEIDETAFLIENISHKAKAGQFELRYWVRGTYSDFPEGGTWGDHIMAVSDEDAEFQARFTMACNESSASFESKEERPNIDDFCMMVVSTMRSVNIVSTSVELVDVDDIAAAANALVTSAAGMIAAYGNCGSPAQQEAAKALQAAINAGKAVLRSHAASTNPSLARALGLEETRRGQAELHATAYDYGLSVAGQSGWEFTTPGAEWKKKIYLLGEDGDAPTQDATLTVVFKDEQSAEIGNVYATLNGVAIGSTGLPLQH